MDEEQKTLGLSNVNHLEKLYNGWFLDYASYTILDRAVPYFEDGLKPVQRRILHTMYEMHDGSFHKVAGIVGDTMHYHPHGDASIYTALVNMGQKNLLIEPQGNWGNPLTGDEAAAPRYIEGKLSEFALDVMFNPETTEWIPNYDGRSKEPVTLPAKFPILLAQGVDGIAVGLSTTILPHNFKELCQASIDYLRGRKFTLYPDFYTGGIIDVSEYNDGERGGRLKVRAKIEKLDNKTLVIREIPFGTTTDSLIDSIVAANDKGKIKIKQIVDHTTENVEIQIHLQAGSDPQVVIDALYAFTDCQTTLAANSCVIIDKKPKFSSTTELLKLSTDHTVHLLDWELDNELKHLQDQWHMTSLEKIFIEKEVYEVIKKAKTHDEMVQLIDEGLKPYVRKLRREVTREEILKLAEIPVRRISRFDRKKADEFLEYEEVYQDRFYGTLKSQVENQLEAGDSVVFDVDVKGGVNIKKFYGGRALSIFVQPPSVEELRRRLNGRGTDAPEVIEQRLAKANYELTFAPQFDHIVVNDNLEKAEQEVYKLVSDFLNQE